MDNLLTIAIIVIVLWLILSAGYLYIGRQQNNLQDEIDFIHELLQDDDEPKSTL